MLYGIDISHYNDGLAQKELSTGNPEFALIKVSEGKSWRDSCAKKYVEICIAREIPMFFYHYCRPDVNKGPELEVNNFLLAVQEVMGGRYDVPVGLVIDWEQDSIGHEIWLESFIKVLRDNSGCKPLLYCSQSVCKKAGFFLDVNKVDLWVAHWGREEGKPGNVAPWTTWAFHQYGVVGGLDRNVFKQDNSLGSYQSYWIPKAEADNEPEDGKHCCCCSCGEDCNKCGK